jgi:hypothetical protein
MRPEVGGAVLQACNPDAQVKAKGLAQNLLPGLYLFGIAASVPVVAAPSEVGVPRAVAVPF